MIRSNRIFVFPLAFVLLSSGCKHNGSAGNTATASNSSPVAQTAPAVDPATLGKVEGVIRFTGKAPERIKIDMSADPACALADNGKPGGANLTEQYVVTNGKLANVFVYIKSGAPASAAPASVPPVMLDQKSCRYVPHVIGVQAGGSVQFRNSDPTMHNIHMVSTVGGNGDIDISQGPNGAPETRQFKTPELMLPVRCNNHPWMNAFINVANSPYFAVSATDGSFSIDGLPPGTYTLAAVHEKLGEQDTQVTVAPRGTAKANFSFGPK